MTIQKRALSVGQAAAVCGVCRSTVGYWIRSKRIRANRSGRNYSIPLEELVLFLKSTGRNIPDELACRNLQGPCFRTIQNCWEYWQDRPDGHNCQNCTAFVNRLEVCFAAREIGSLCCTASCHECKYYLEIYLPRIQFIHQISLPAAIYKDLVFWGGNRSWTELCEVQEKDLPGMGIERVVHPDSMHTVISHLKKRALGDLSVPRTSNIFLKNTQRGKLKVRMSVYLLTEPSGTNLILAECDENESHLARSRREDDQWH